MDDYEIDDNENKDISADDDLVITAKRYSLNKREDIGDIFAFQSVVCILSATVFLILNLFFPDECGDIYFKFINLIQDENEIIANPFTYFMGGV